MSNTKTVMGQAANTQGIPLDITDVFSTYLYTGTGAALTINNGIDLAGEGGLVWIKGRDAARSHQLLNTEVGLSGTGSRLKSDSTAVSSNDTATSMSSFNSDGFSINYANDFNANGEDFASWTFRKAPKFFDVVTYTGTQVAGLAISHNLGSVPGTIIVKRTNDTNAWTVYHRSLGNNKKLELNKTDSIVDIGNSSAWNTTTPTDTQFFLGADGAVNANGGTYVAYLFAHNDGDGGFGPSGDQDIIKCGSYTGNGATDGPEINLGFEPQWLLVKNASGVSNWLMVDNMRGFPVGSDNARLFANLSNAEVAFNGIDPTATGFKLVNSTGGYNTSGNDYIYMAIRRGPLAPPESATEVFAIDTQGSTGDGQAPAFRSTFPVDTAFVKSTAGGGTTFASRLTGTKYLRPEETSAEYTNTQVVFDYMNGFRNNTVTFAPNHGYLWKRAPNYFDVVAYTGDGASTQDIAHNLGVAPEFIFLKSRNLSSVQWPSWHSGTPNHSRYLNSTFGGFQTAGGLPPYVGQNVTDTTFRVSTDGSASQSNGSGNTYIAYLFASLPGISKVGSYTGNGGASQDIDCGFTSGARFVMVKAASGTGDWWIWDTERGITAGNDSSMRLNTTDAAVTTLDFIDPLSSGFTVVGSDSSRNGSGIEYIFYAIA